MTRTTHCLSLIALLGLVAGCLSAVPYTPIQRYGIVPNVDVQTREQAVGPLAIRPLEYAQQYSLLMVYRPDEFTVLYQDTEHWAEPPRDSVTRALRDALATTGFFSDVGSASDVPLPEYILTGHLRRFDEMRTTSPPHALCEVRIEVRENARPARVLLAKTYRESRAMNENSASAFAEAMTSCVSTIVEQATNDLIAALEESSVDS